MEAPHGPGAEAPVLHFFIPLYLSALLDPVVEPLEVHGGQLAQLDIPDGRDDMVLDIVAVVFCCVFLHCWLAVIFVPQPAPLGHCVLLSLDKVYLFAGFDGLL